MVQRILALPLLCLLATNVIAATPLARSNSDGNAGQAVFVAPSAFPTSLFSTYNTAPTGTVQEPRPAISKDGSGGFYSVSVDQPYPLPTGPPAREAVYPKAIKSDTTKNPDYANAIQANITTIINDTSKPACQRCIDALKLGQELAHSQPKKVPQVLINLCTQYKFSSTKSGLSQAEVCKREYSGATLGSSLTQILSYANLQGENPSDGLYICTNVIGAKSGCSLPKPIDLHANGFLDNWFGGKEKRLALRKRNEVAPAVDASLRRRKSQNLRVLHFSDIHVDPRFFIGGEAACTSGQCCRSDSFNATVATGPPQPAGSFLPRGNISEEAVYWGNYHCDSPWPLAVSAMQSVKHLNDGKPVDMSLYTGDMVTHDSDWHLSQDLVTYTQQAIFDTMKKTLGSGPVFSAIGNHDTAPSDQSAPKDLPDQAPREQFSFDWSNLQRLFEAEGWFTHEEAKQVSKHYGGYSVSPRKGLRIITLNTDFWYKANRFNFINTTNPDAAGILRFLTDELEGAEKRNERAWIVGHVLTGWDGSNVLANPTNLFAEIVNHYSPKTIAHIFFGHTHEDQFNVFYSTGGQERMAKNARAVSFMSPSITPGTNVNPSVRIYTVDPETYSVMDYDQFYTQADDFKSLPQSNHGPIWRHLYSAREAYGTFNATANSNTIVNGTIALDSGSRWPANAPLNATFWSALTEEMQKRPALIEQFRSRQSRLSPRSPPCNTTCLEAQICYMRSATNVIGQQCPPGFASVQGG